MSIMTEARLNCRNGAQQPHRYSRVEFRWSGFRGRDIICGHVFWHATTTPPVRKNKITHPVFMSRRNSCPKLPFLPQCRPSSCLAHVKNTSAPPRWSRSQPPSMWNPFRANRNTKPCRGQGRIPVPVGPNRAAKLRCRPQILVFCLHPMLENLWSSPCACVSLCHKRKAFSCVAGMAGGTPPAHIFTDSDNRRYACPSSPFLQFSAQPLHWGPVQSTSPHQNRFPHLLWLNLFRPRAAKSPAGQALPAPARAPCFGAGLQLFGGQPC